MASGRAAAGGGQLENERPDCVAGRGPEACGSGWRRPGLRPGVDVMICPPATLVGALAKDAAGSRLQVGGQDCHKAASGAHTGDIAAEMLKDAGARR